MKPLVQPWHWKCYNLTLISVLIKSKKVFHFRSNLQKLGAKSNPWALFNIHLKRRYLLRVVIWHPFLEIWAKVKNFLRLSHLYVQSHRFFLKALSAKLRPRGLNGLVPTFQEDFCIWYALRHFTVATGSQ